LILTIIVVVRKLVKSFLSIKIPYFKLFSSKKNLKANHSKKKIKIDSIKQKKLNLISLFRDVLDEKKKTSLLNSSHQIELINIKNNKFRL
jgi:hypothetical protein